MYHGDIRLGDTIDLKFTTRSFTTGAPTTLAGTPVISAYVGNGTTEITAGITLSVDFDSRTGLHNVRVVATSGNGFATATNVQLVITTGTVGGVSVVGEVIGTFSIECRSALMPTTAARTLVVDAAGLADANMVKAGPTGSGTAQTAGDIPGKTNSLVFTVANQVDSNVLDWKSATAPAMTGDAFARLGAPVGASIAADVAAVQADTDNIQTRLPAALTANGNMKSSLLEIIATALSEGAAGRIAAAWQGMFNVTSPVLTAQSVNQTGDNFARLGAPAFTTIAGDIADAKTNIMAKLPAALVGGRIDASVGAFNASIVDTTFSVASGKRQVRQASAQSGAATTITLDASASAVNDFYIGLPIYLTTTGQVRIITAYDGATKIATINRAWDTIPTVDNFCILPMPTDAISEVAIAAAIAAVQVDTTAIKAKTDNLPEGVKKNTALANFEFFMADSADHVTGKTGLTVVVQRSIDGGAFADSTNTPATEVANGVYKINLSAADLNGTVITYKMTAVGADSTFVTVKTTL